MNLIRTTWKIELCTQACRPFQLLSQWSLSSITNKTNRIVSRIKQNKKEPKGYNQCLLCHFHAANENNLVKYDNVILWWDNGPILGFSAKNNWSGKCSLCFVLPNLRWFIFIFLNIVLKLNFQWNSRNLRICSVQMVAT